MKPYLPLRTEDYFGKAAGLQAPWRASKCAVNDVTRTVHLWVTNQAVEFEQRHGWFGAKTVQMAPRQTHLTDRHWRHVDCMDYTCFIHTADSLEPADHELDWFGPPDLPFTKRIAKKIFLLLMEGTDLQVICDIFKVPFAELWKFKYDLDNGLLHFEYTPSARRKRKDYLPPVASEATRLIAIASDVQNNRETLIGVPEMTDPVWEKLITGGLNIQIKTLGFQLLLTKLRQQVRLLQSADVKIMKLRELHRYVERHERVLKHELAQLNQD